MSTFIGKMTSKERNSLEVYANKEGVFDCWDVEESDTEVIMTFRKIGVKAAPVITAPVPKPVPAQPVAPPAPVVVVHVLKNGFPLCMFSTKSPGSWPSGNAWVRTRNEVARIQLNANGQVPCQGCITSDQYHDIPQ